MAKKLNQLWRLNLLKKIQYTIWNQQSLRKQKLGTYKCVATNSVGSAECEAVVTLYGKIIFMINQEM